MRDVNLGTWTRQTRLGGAGNCAGDYAAAMALARTSRLNTAMTAVYAGPLLDVLVALPAGFWILLSQGRGRAVDVALSPALTAGGALLVAQCVATLLIARANQGFLPRWYGRAVACTYAVYLVAVVVLVAVDGS